MLRFTGGSPACVKSKNLLCAKGKCGYSGIAVRKSGIMLNHDTTLLYIFH